MLGNNKLLIFFFSICITICTSAVLYFTQTASAIGLFFNATITFTLTFTVFYVFLENYIFSQVDRLENLLENLKKEDVKVDKKTKVNQSGPIAKINDQFYSYAFEKQKEIDQLKKLEMLRRDFLAEISHELKTPTFAAQGYIDTLIDGAINDKDNRMKFLKRASKSLDSLNNLIQDIITISLLETGELSMSMSNFNLKEACEEVFDMLRPMGEKKNIDFKLKSDIEKPIVKADKFRIKQVLNNLVANAIKYGNEEGSVLIDIIKVGKKIEISIIDNGPGIEMEHLSKIFEKFYRVDKSRSRDSGGTGLGLTIVQNIINAHNSKIKVESKKDKGTIFTFHLESRALI